MSTIRYHEIQNFDNQFSREEVTQNVLFILDQGWNKAIKECAEAGVSILLPNFHMSAKLLVQTIIRERKLSIATSTELWEKMNYAFAEYPHLRQSMRVFLFKEIENIAF